MYDLRPYQQPIAAKVFDYLRRNPGKHPLVALPTGSGKTIVMSDIISQAIKNWPDTKILVLSHVKEILNQDYEAIKKHTGLDVGVNSASIGRREVHQVTVAGIQSVYRHSELYKYFNLIIIDECHLIPPSDNSMYRKFFSGLDKPRYLGLTATPFRLGYGKIYGEKESLFDDLVYDLTSSHAFIKLIDDGYLCNLQTRRTKTEMQTKDLPTVGGDFDKQAMSDAFNITKITKSACKEIVKHGENYKKWLIFAIDIKHAESIAETLNGMGIPALVMHSKMDFNREFVIKTFKEGGVRALVNINMLTTGFDDPEIDLIAMLRPTQSPVLHVQTIGRGLRIAPGKDHCLVLDFAGNTERLGPINNIKVRRTRKGQDPDSVGDPPCKVCPGCEAILPIITRKCPWCGHDFPIRTELKSRASNAEIITKKLDVDWYDVKDVAYFLHQKPNRPSMLKVSYNTGMKFFNEYVCMNHEGRAKSFAAHWAKMRGSNATTSEELYQDRDKLKRSRRIKVDTRGQYPTIVDSIL